MARMIRSAHSWASRMIEQYHYERTVQSLLPRRSRGTGSPFRLRVL